MYKVNSRNEQGRKSRILPRMLPAAPPVLTDEQRRQNFVSRLKQIEAELSDTKEKQRRKELGVQKQRLQDEIHALRAKPKMPEVADYFIDAAKELLSPLQFGRIMREAVIKSGNVPVGDPR